MHSIAAILKALLKTLTIPFGADPSDSAIFLGTAVPSELTTYYAGNSETVVAAIIFRLDSDDYIYLANVRGNSGTYNVLSMGMNQSGTLREVMSLNYGGTIYQVTLGDPVSNLPVSVLLDTTTLPRLQNGAVFEAGANAVFQDVAYLQRAANLNPIMAHVDQDEQTVDSSTFTTTETVVQSVTFPEVSGVTYWIEWDGAWNTDDTTARITQRIRQDSVSGTVLQEQNFAAWTVASSTDGWPARLVARYPATATGSKTIVVTGDRISGAGNVWREAASTRPTYLNVYQIAG